MTALVVLLAIATVGATALLAGVQVATRWARTEVQLPDTSRGLDAG